MSSDPRPPGSWEARVAQLWDDADRSRPEEVLAVMRDLWLERGEDDADALAEWAGAHDFAGLEAQAIPLYRRALERGVAGHRRDETVIQLASSLRHVGDAAAAVDVLDACPVSLGMRPAAQAFRALALRDLGRADEAVSVALEALAPLLPQYSGAVTRFAHGRGADREMGPSRLRP